MNELYIIDYIYTHILNNKKGLIVKKELMRRLVSDFSIVFWSGSWVKTSKDATNSSNHDGRPNTITSSKPYTNGALSWGHAIPHKILNTSPWGGKTTNSLFLITTTHFLTFICISTLHAKKTPYCLTNIYTIS